MQNSPPADVYVKFFEYMPHGILIDQVIKVIIEHTPQNGRLLDLICGPGYLLGRIQEARPDIKCVGVDLENEYIEYAKKKYPEIHFEVADARTWQTEELFDAVICTGGVHHLPDADQEPFLGKLKRYAQENGFIVITDPYIDDFTTDQERLLASAKLGYEYLAFTIAAGAPPDIVDAAIQILRNDVLLIEWKTSIAKRLAMLQKHFQNIQCSKAWPQDGTQGYGDYYWVLRG